MFAECKDLIISFVISLFSKIAKNRIEIESKKWIIESNRIEFKN